MATAVSVSATNNPEIDGLLSGYKWSGTISYSFPDSPSDYITNYSSSNEPTTSGFSSAPVQMQTATTYAVGLISSYTNATFTFNGTGSADIAVAQSPAANPTSYAYYPNNAAAGGDVWFGTSYNYSQAALGNYYFATAMHELGHAVGLKHSQETGGVANVAVPAAHDDSEYSIMSYRSYQGGPLTGYTNEAYGYPQTYMANDILALQTMYGANYNTHSENTVYSWSATTGQEFINGVAQPAPGGGAGGSANRVFMTVWDGNGVDTYDLSNYSTAVSINLNPGASSITSTTQLANLGTSHYAAGNVYNAYLYNNDPRSYIDNAIGGAGNDTLIGNAIANNLNGGNGNDTLTGGGGNDTIIGGAGTDVAVYSGNKANYLITYNSTTQTFTVADQRSGTPDGTDTVSGVENFQFADGAFASSTLLAAPVNHAPVVSLPSGSFVTASTAGQVFQLSSLFTASDADNDTLTYYVLDNTVGANTGHLKINGVLQTEGQWIQLSQAQLSQTTFTAGQSGADSLVLSVFDASSNGIAGVQVIASVNHAPVVSLPSGANVTASTVGQAFQLSSLFAASDADNDALTYYVLDNTVGANTGHLLVNGVQQTEGQWIKLSQAQLSQTTFTAGQGGGDDLVFSVFDTLSNGIGGVHVTASANHAPVVSLPSGANVTASTAGQVFQLSSLFTASDSDNDALTYYVLDNTVGASTGHLKVNGVLQTEGQWIKLTQAQLSQTTFTAGQSGGDDLVFSVFDASSNAIKGINVSVAKPSAATPLATIIGDFYGGGGGEHFSFGLQPMQQYSEGFPVSESFGGQLDAVAWLLKAAAGHDGIHVESIETVASHIVHAADHFFSF